MAFQISTPAPHQNDDTSPSSHTSSTASVHNQNNSDIEKQHSVPINDQNDPSQPAAEAEKAPSLNPMDPSSFPDGGPKAWLCVLGGFCCLIASFGWINAIGIFQTYYEQNQLSEYTSQEIAWIPSLEAFCMFAGGSWVSLYLS